MPKGLERTKQTKLQFMLCVAFSSYCCVPCFRCFGLDKLNNSVVVCCCFPCLYTKTNQTHKCVYTCSLCFFFSYVPTQNQQGSTLSCLYFACQVITDTPNKTIEKPSELERTKKAKDLAEPNIIFRFVVHCVVAFLGSLCVLFWFLCVCVFWLDKLNKQKTHLVFFCWRVCRLPSKQTKQPLYLCLSYPTIQTQSSSRFFVFWLCFFVPTMVKQSLSKSTDV